jgi:agmatine/peptidylarginine deiminase
MLRILQSKSKRYIVLITFFSLAILMTAGYMIAQAKNDGDIRVDVEETQLRRVLPKRAPVPWPKMVARRKSQFAANPNDPQFARPLVIQEQISELKVICANEADPVEGVLTEWECTSTGVPDEWDRMWMAIIGATVRGGATAYVYLYSYLGHDDATTLAAAKAMVEDAAGISGDDVYWIQDYETDAFWIRDFGPLFVRDIKTQKLSIEDPLYYPLRPSDDAQPVDFAGRIGVPFSEFNLYFEGGNFLPNGGGLAIVSSVVLDANPHYSEYEIREMFRQELGCKELVIVQALDDWATGHVDMWLAWANRTTLVVGEYTKSQDRVNHDIIADNVANKLTGLRDPETGEEITIVRMPMPSNYPPNLLHAEPPGFPTRFRLWRTYLNVVQINGTVLMPVYAQDRTYEAEATQIWGSLGFEVLPVTTDAITPLAGQLHCLTKTLDAPTHGNKPVVVAPPVTPARSAEFALGQSFPNPFNPDTWIPYHLSENVDVMIRIYSASGRLIRTLDLGHRPAGLYTTKDKAAYWDGKNGSGEEVASGLYFYNIQAGEYTATRKMVVAR